MRYKKCPICGEKIVTGTPNMIAHVNDEHEDDIPQGMYPGEYLYILENKHPRKCMMCPKPTAWNVATNKFNTFCSGRCKDKYVELVHARLKKTHGVEFMTRLPDHQRKMLAGRSISGNYHWTDGGISLFTGSYEEDFCRMNDTFLNMESADISMPSPNTYEYMYKGEKKFYIPDAFIYSLGLEIEIKDGGDNPNMHHKIQDVDKVKERNKDEVMLKQKDFHYIKIENKDYSQYFALIKKLRDDDLTEMERIRKIKIVPGI